MTEITFGKAKIDDLNQIETLVKTAEGDERLLTGKSDWKSLPWDRNCWKNQYRYFIVARIGDEIIGCVRKIAAEKDVLEISSLVVKEEHRRKGVGSRLVKEILRRFWKRPFYIICRPKNLNFYTKLGFREESVKNLPLTLKKDFKKMNENWGSHIVMQYK